MNILEKIIDFYEEYNIIFLMLLAILFVAALVTRCTYTTSCKHCGYDYENDLIIATQPNHQHYKMCPNCGHPTDLEIHNNLNLLTRKEKKSTDK